MSAVKSRVSLRSLVLTPERIPSFINPLRSPLLASPRLLLNSPDRTRLLSDCDDGGSPPASQPNTPTNPRGSKRFTLRLPSPAFGRARSATAAPAECADVDAITCAAMSLTHIPKVTTPYGFRAVLATSPCTNRRESLFHRHKQVKVTVTEDDAQTPATPRPATAPGRSLGPRLQPLKALGLQVMNELKKPVASLKALGSSPRMTAAPESLSD
ncbi:uncharacterized protein LOC101171924 [Oryzias latipes]|uniref:uncharacterized protein LOC101171924 n=1 Tax=Oryzias latipes TaxID=8090 RepID=UPI0000E9C253|nr:uncharacterized protein LOC101171924 [Oryzias latipes]